ncbi:MAG: hypothetical protein HF300_16615 [Ignavibacteria bacterium]|nr:hypothetical protein [Ignavibacteria bacterium]MCU7501017.1 hypothetical protein [Ignavibacteria bacterium]MCU7514185.1 hypothetical protein [Ignavibacteria bacterium]MCU7522038.1 hypothetical protein [Ignavibacteria bacterium]MCU7525329.1 hypothetical protein [Ignavibacteria bacterium]
MLASFKRYSILLTLCSMLIMSAISCKKSPVAPVEAGSGNYDVCYIKLAGLNWEVFLNSAGGTNSLNISKGEYEDSSPYWSPDGRYILYNHHYYTSSSTGGVTLLLCDLEKDSTRNLTSEVNYSPSALGFTPDGKKIIYGVHVIGEKNRIYTMNLDGTQKRKLLDFDAVVFFYPDSYTFLYWMPDAPTAEYHKIYKSNLDGTMNIEVLDLKDWGENAGLCDISPSKNEVIFTISNEPLNCDFLLRYNFSSHECDTLYRSETNYQILSAQYSNDYSKICFEEIGNSSSSKTRLRLIEGSSNMLLAEMKFPEMLNLQEGAFSPNGNNILFRKFTIVTGGGVMQKSKLYSINVSTKEMRFIEDDVEPRIQWNPKSEY